MKPVDFLLEFLEYMEEKGFYLGGPDGRRRFIAGFMEWRKQRRE